MTGISVRAGYSRPERRSRPSLCPRAIQAGTKPAGLPARFGAETPARFGAGVSAETRRRFKPARNRRV